MEHIDSMPMDGTRCLRMLAPSEGMIATAAGPLEVAVIGPDDGRPLVLVDHAMGSCGSLHHIAQALAVHGTGRKVVTWSRPGCGRSPPTSERSGLAPLDHEASVVLPALMAALALESADLLGYGDGATIAMMFAARHPERVGRVIAIAPYGFADDQSRLSNQALPEQEFESGLSARLGSSHADAEATYRRWRLRLLSDHASGWSAIAGLANMIAPLLLVQGTLDEFNSAEQVRAVADAVSGPVNWVFLRHQGHFLPQDVPEQIVSLAGAHLEGRCRKLHS